MTKYSHIKSSVLSVIQNKWVFFLIPLAIFIGAKSSSPMPVASPHDISIHNMNSGNEMFVDPEDEEFDMNHDGFQLTRRKNSEKEDYGEECMVYNMTDDVDKADCSPGSMYIVRCMQCICPYSGSITPFCRPMPRGMYCEQAYPGYNFLPMRRRPKLNGKSKDLSTNPPVINHYHSKYECNETGRIMDECYVCDCVDGVLIEEHCFQKDAQECATALPSFLKYENKKIMLL